MGRRDYDIQNQNNEHPFAPIAAEEVLFFRQRLGEWFNIYKRDLPWRGTRDPYLIWVSEVILQQTRVVQGWHYYLRFVERYPTVEALASSSEEELLLYWQGLGYYSRAHNMLAAARTIMQEHGGVFPRDPISVAKLKGIGAYTQAAVLSIAFDEPIAAVDGNVYRVLSRFLATDTPIDIPLGTKMYRYWAQTLLDPNSPGRHNQAVMELGALVCTPTAPQCMICPLQERCGSAFSRAVEQRPVKSKRIQVTEYYLHFFCIVYGGKYLFAQRRGNDSIWKGLWQFPLIEGATYDEIQEQRRTYLASFAPQSDHEIYTSIHRLTHRLLHIYIEVISLPIAGELPAALQDYLPIEIEKHHEYAFPKPLREWLDSTFTID